MSMSIMAREAIIGAQVVEQRVRDEHPGNSDEEFMRFRIHMATLAYCAEIVAEASSKMRAEE